MREKLINVAGILGFISVLYGVSMWSMPLAFIVGGMIIVALAIKLV